MPKRCTYTLRNLQPHFESIEKCEGYAFRLLESGTFLRADFFGNSRFEINSMVTKSAQSLQEDAKDMHLQVENPLASL